MGNEGSHYIPQDAARFRVPLTPAASLALSSEVPSAPTNEGGSSLETTILRSRKPSRLEERRVQHQALVKEADEKGYLNKLPPRQRIVLKTKYRRLGEGIPRNREVATELALSKKNVDSQEWDGLRRLAEKLGKIGMFKESKSFHKNRGSHADRLAQYQALVKEAKEKGCLDNLPDKTRKVLESKYLNKDGKIHVNREVAIELGMIKQSVNTQEWDGLRRLAEKLGKIGMFKESKAFHKNRGSREERRMARNASVKEAIRIKGLPNDLSEGERKVIEIMHLGEEGSISARKAAILLKKNVKTVITQEFMGVRKILAASQR